MDHVSSRGQHDADDRRHGKRTLTSALKRGLLAALALLGVVGFTALGIWQVERRAWKLNLIARVEARIHAPPVALPDRTAWHSLAEADIAYSRVRISGTFLHDRETLVQALTERGAGFWVLTPLRSSSGIVLVNRGFVPQDRRDPASRTASQVAGPVTVTGLLRPSEPAGGFLRRNDPAADRWYSRDVTAIARTRHLGETAPFFVDADAAPNPSGYPVGGLTVVQFANNHLVYALTWFGLALLCAGGGVLALKDRA